ncbi:MAG: pyrimidine-nucleoside phosphorylase [Lachnospiraceae bacterium]|nr:pyrimidine-nucleoside phosphorylase [Lachnospiraceae bacterium]
MRMVDLILKKKRGEALTKEEIDFVVTNFVNGEIPDYQMSAFLMAVCFKGMTKEETAIFTDAFAHSGDMVDLSAIKGIKVDKHSTGGVGDKTTLVIAPIVASCGVKVAKMSGRGLGHTGGTIDKLEAIPGFNTTIDKDRFFEIVNEIGVSVIGQSGNLTPADKKCYALRDVTGTVDSIPLIAISIMSKKLAAGSDCILLDVKTGSGAFMKTVDDSIELAKTMVDIGTNCGRKVVALITDMDIPLGDNIGNALEVIEAIETLKGQGPKDLTEVCIELAANMLYMAKMGDIDKCRKMVKDKIESGEALQVLAKMAKAQGGDPEYILHPEKFTIAPVKVEVKAEKDGFISHMDAEGIGISSTMLGAGRETKESVIDFGAGIKLVKKTHDKVSKGDTIAILYTSDEKLVENAKARFLKSVTIEDKDSKVDPLIFARVTHDNIERY